MRRAPLRQLLTRSELPIDSLLPVVIESVRKNPVTLLQAEPGAGKTTRVPPALLDAGFGSVCVLEPRRIAARLAAHRVAQERGEAVGASVGYQVRFEQQSSARTRLWFLTEGLFTRRFAADPQLRGIEIVILDEFHERNLDTDVSLALLLRLQRTRPELKLLLMSATLGGESLSRQLGGVPLIHAPGRQFAVNIRHTPATAAPLDAQVAAAVENCVTETDGHVLIFLPGAVEIRKAMDSAQGVAQRAGALTLPLHGDLPAGEQDRAVAHSTRRKLIFSTNVAESSITIDGVRSVVDSGLARVASWSSWSGLGRNCSGIPPTAQWPSRPHRVFGASEPVGGFAPAGFFRYARESPGGWRERSSRASSVGAQPAPAANNPGPRELLDQSLHAGTPRTFPPIPAPQVA